MISLRRRALILAFKTFDLVGIVFSFFVAARLGIFGYHDETVSLVHIFSMSIEIRNLIFLLSFTLVSHIIFNLFGLYRSKRFSSRWGEFADVIKAISVVTLVMLSLTFLFRIEIVNPIFILIFWIISNAISLLGRSLMRYSLSHMRISGRNLRFMIIVGTNHRGIQFARRIEVKKELGYRIIGFVDSDWSRIGEFRKTGYDLVADYNDFPTFVKNNVVDEVMICLPMKSFYSQAFQVVTICEEQGIIVRFLPNIFDLKFARSITDQFEGEPVMALFTGAMEGWPILLKRIVDISVSLISIIILLPLFLGTAVIIKATSPGPVFFVQDRVGLGKRRFRLYKFRTMTTDAEQRQSEVEHLNEVSGPVFKIKNDPRITRVGKVLRKISVDELPQLINILSGDMSLVGPRPLPVRDYSQFDKDWHRRRFSVRPGLTCLWQVTGRSSISFEKWMQLDMDYIDNWSLGLDIKILFMTIPAVLRGTGAE
jgi:exopolysaccharide biosynthesis polyprenyl glycosylphosphotransferase